MSNKHYPDGADHLPDARKMVSDAQALTREQVVGICLDFYGDLPTVEQRDAIVRLRDSDNVLRQALTQQAQEVELLKKEHTRYELDYYDVRRQLAAMTAERDEAVTRRSETVAMCTTLQATLAEREEALRRANVDQCNTEAMLNDAVQEAGRLRKALGGMCSALEQEINRTSCNDAGRGPTNYPEYVSAKKALRETGDDQAQRALRGE